MRRLSKTMAEEWEYRYHERLGIMTDGKTPTHEQDAIATQEANAAVDELGKRERWGEEWF